MRLFRILSILCLVKFILAKKNKLNTKNLAKQNVVLPTGFKSVKKACLKKSQFDAKKLLNPSKKIKKKKIICAFISFQANAEKIGKLSDTYRDSAEALARFKQFSSCLKKIAKDKEVKEKIYTNLGDQGSELLRSFNDKDIKLHKCDLFKDELDELDWLTSEQLDFLGIVFPNPKTTVPRYCLEKKYHDIAAISSIKAGSPDEDYYCAFASFQALDSRLSKKYNNLKEARKRMDIFKTNVDDVNEHNGLEGISWTSAINQFSDLKPKESWGSLGFLPDLTPGIKYKPQSVSQAYLGAEEGYPQLIIEPSLYLEDTPHKSLSEDELYMSDDKPFFLGGLPPIYGG